MIFFIYFCSNGEKNENLEFKLFAKYELIVKIQKNLKRLYIYEIKFG